MYLYMYTIYHVNYEQFSLGPEILFYSIFLGFDLWKLELWNLNFAPVKCGILVNSSGKFGWVLIENI